jgi:hypothetical protein
LAVVGTSVLRTRVLAGIPRPARADVALGGLVLAAAAASLVLRARTPPWILSDFYVDYGLYGTLGGHLAAGQWLGPFETRTLVKGPAYPMFIDLSYRLHVPLVIAEQLLYLFAAAVSAVALGRLARSRWLGGFTFVLLALNPIHLGAWGSMLVRENVYTSLSILLVGCTLLLVSVIPSAVRTRYGWGYFCLVAAGGFVGAVGAAYYLCREERAWVVPAMLVAVVGGMWSWRRRIVAVGPRIWAGLVVTVLAGGAVGYMCVNVVVQTNRDHYGSGVVSDIADGQLARAYTAWQSVRVGPRIRRYPVPASARAAAYRVSPAAAELRPYLEGRIRRLENCEKGVCDYNGAFFVWALREAITDAGHLHNEVQLQTFSRALADQIDAGCRDKALSCGGGGLPMIPAAQWSDVGPILASGVDATSYVLSFDSAAPGRFPTSHGLAWTWQQTTRAIRGASDQKAFRTAEQSAMRHQQPVTVLQHLYRWLAYPAIVLALIGMLWEFWRPRLGRNRALSIGMLALLIALLSRIAVFAVLDALSYPSARNPYYVIPSTDLLVLFAASGCWLFAAHLSSVFVARRAHVPADADVAASDADAGSAEADEPAVISAPTSG